MNALDLQTAERALASWRESFPRPLVDLSSLQRFDPYGLLLLVLEGRRCLEAAGRVRVLLPENAQVRAALAKADPFAFLEGAVWLNGELPSPREGTLMITARAEEEAGVHSLVDELTGRLHRRFPLARSSVRILSMAMLELFQNIPQHANPRGARLDPFGLGALQELADHIHLVVADKGVGLLGSLAQGGRGCNLDHASALEAALVDGMSRLAHPGRGGALRRIRELVLREGGEFYVRSGRGAFLQRGVEWSVGAVLPFPGVQVSVRLPRALFEG
ncbi:MAG: hypothetical protein R6U88_05400 [Candidatus Bipolaricaulota bacterium]